MIESLLLYLVLVRGIIAMVLLYFLFFTGVYLITGIPSLILNGILDWIREG